jgi:hypothetical protein
MAAKRKNESETEETAPLPDILTVSEHDKLSDDEKQAFRARNGTVTNDPN